MSAAFEWFTGVVGRALGQVWETFSGVWPFLLISIAVAAALTTYVGADWLASALQANVAVAVGGAVALATFTPFCSCGRRRSCWVRWPRGCRGHRWWRSWSPHR